MTDRHAGYVVTLAKDIREDDAEATIAALKMVRGVLAVSPVVADIGQLIAESRRDVSWIEHLMLLIDDMRGNR